MQLVDYPAAGAVVTAAAAATAAMISRSQILPFIYKHSALSLLFFLNRLLDNDNNGRR
jgi:hypothetical protein